MAGKTKKTEAVDDSRPRSAARFGQRREEIVDQAAAVFAQRGFHGTSIHDLSVATGLKRGGLYYYIGSKETLLIRIHERFIVPLLEEARSIVARGESPDEELRLLANALIKDIVQYQDQVTVFLHEWRLVQSTPEWRDVSKSRREFEKIIVNCIKRGRDDGTFRDIDVSLAMRGFLGMINYTYMWLRSDGRTSATKVSDTFSDIVLMGILADPGRHNGKTSAANSSRAKKNTAPAR